MASKNSGKVIKITNGRPATQIMWSTESSDYVCTDISNDVIAWMLTSIAQSSDDNHQIILLHSKTGSIRSDT